MIPWKEYDKDGPPSNERFVLVYFPGTQNCHTFDTRYFIASKPGKCWGWYPGGARPDGTYWVDVEDVPKP